VGSLGYVLVWVGFAGGLVVAGGVLARPIDAAPLPLVSRVLVVVGLVGLIAVMWVPFLTWLEGPARGTGQWLELRGADSMDQISVGLVNAITVVAVGVALGMGRKPPRTSYRPSGSSPPLSPSTSWSAVVPSRAATTTVLAACVSAVVVGNLLVRLADAAGPSVGTGWIIGAAVAQVPLVGALMALAARRAKVGG